MRQHEFVKQSFSAKPRSAHFGFLRVFLLFGSVALALGLILVPLLNRQSDAQLTQSIFQNGIDHTLTGSIKK